MLKKFFIALVFLASSCAHNDFVVNVDFNLYKSALKTDNKSINVIVVDNRVNDRIIGQKISGGKVAQITTNQDLVDLLQKKITNNLTAKGFLIGLDFTIKVEVEELNYESSRGFIVGDARSYGRIKVTVIANNDGSQFSKNYELHHVTKYFIISNKEEDQDNIQRMIQELISDFLSDAEIMGHMGVSINYDANMEKFMRRMYTVI